MPHFICGLDILTFFGCTCDAVLGSRGRPLGTDTRQEWKIIEDPALRERIEGNSKSVAKSKEDDVDDRTDTHRWRPQAASMSATVLSSSMSGCTPRRFVRSDGFQHLPPSWLDAVSACRRLWRVSERWRFGVKETPSSTFDGSLEFLMCNHAKPRVKRFKAELLVALPQTYSEVYKVTYGYVD